MTTEQWDLIYIHFLIDTNQLDKEVFHDPDFDEKWNELEEKDTTDSNDNVVGQDSTEVVSQGKTFEEKIPDINSIGDWEEVE